MMKNTFIWLFSATAFGTAAIFGIAALGEGHGGGHGGGAGHTGAPHVSAGGGHRSSGASFSNTAHRSESSLNRGWDAGSANARNTSWYQRSESGHHIYRPPVSQSESRIQQLNRLDPVTSRYRNPYANNNMPSMAGQIMRDDSLPGPTIPSSGFSRTRGGDTNRQRNSSEDRSHHHRVDPRPYPYPYPYRPYPNPNWWNRNHPYYYSNYGGGFVYDCGNGVTYNDYNSQDNSLIDPNMESQCRNQAQKYEAMAKEAMQRGDSQQATLYRQCATAERTLEQAYRVGDPNLLKAGNRQLQDALASIGGNTAQ